MTPSLQRRWSTPATTMSARGIPLPISDLSEGMERLWSLAGATGGNRSQMGRPRKPLKQADPQPVATYGNRFGAHGKEGVNGSSPLEGSCESPAKRGFLLVKDWLADGLRPPMEHFLEHPGCGARRSATDQHRQRSWSWLSNSSKARRFGRGSCFSDASQRFRPRTSAVAAAGRSPAPPSCPDARLPRATARTRQPGHPIASARGDPTQ
jgi:hypothetical protein